MSTIQSMPTGVSKPPKQNVASGNKQAKGNRNGAPLEARNPMTKKPSQAVKMAVQSGRQAFNQIMPKPPSHQEMKQARDAATQVARKIYEQNPVRQFPESSRVLEAYAKQQDGVSVGSKTPSLASA
uniref:Uncharacterized protein n=1 Tax=Magnetococcus massalia (strain MO-1) TaxID=451514 RepID=A0A1S7LFG3_MAGMO|nr:Conserved protein of unknown function [Candidatus Magnetococcus massalia]